MPTVVLSHNSEHPISLALHDLLAGHSISPIAVELERAEDSLSRVGPSRTLIVLSPYPDRAVAVLRKVRPLMDGPIIAVGPTTDPKLILRALNEGANHYVDENDLEDQLEAVLARLGPRKEPLTPSTGRLVALLGASGGSGVSTLAVNLAAVLAGEAGRCALVDLHPGAGDLAPLLDLKPAHTLGDLCMKASRMDQAMVESCLVSHPCGIRLLTPPNRYDEISLVSSHGVHKVLTLLRQGYPFVVVDQEDCFHEEQVVALRQADSVLVVFRPDFTSLRNTRRLLEHLDQLDLPRERLQLVLNRCGQAKELPAEEVEQALGMRVAHLLPDDSRTINGANNTGVPAVLKAPSVKISQAIVAIAHSLHPPATATVRPRGAQTKSWLLFR